MINPLFYLPKSFLNAAPEALGLPNTDFDLYRSKHQAEDEVEAGEYEREAQQLWLEMQQQNHLDRLENQTYEH